MGKNLLIIGVVVTAAYLVGVESAKARGKHYEDLRHQLERLWREPQSRRARRRMAKRTLDGVKQLGKAIRA